MNQQIGFQDIFKSNFYIDGQYAMSFVPTIFQSLNNPPAPLAADWRQVLMNRAQSEKEINGSENFVALVEIKQPILKYDELYWGMLGTKSYASILHQLGANPNCIGVVLDIDSGGGQVYGTPQFYDEIKAFSKPIVTYTDGYLCSAAYYIGNAADYIVANKRADAIGSIGAYAHWLDFTGMFEKWGAKSITMYSSESTEKNEEIRKLMEENDPKPYIKNVLDPIVKSFQNDMKEARPGLNEKVFKGGTWPGPEALEMGLVDELGSMATALSKVIELANNSNSNFNNMSDNTQGAENSYSKLAAVLGTEVKTKAGIFFGSKSVSLTEEQLDRLEAALPDPEDSNKIADLQSQLTTAQTAQAAAENKVTALDSAVTAALTKAGLTSEKKATSAENIDFLADKVVEYGGEDGGNPTDVHAEKDPNDPINTESTSIFDSIAN